MASFIVSLQPVFLCVFLAGTVLPLFALMIERTLLRKSSASTRHRLWTLSVLSLLAFPLLALILRGNSENVTETTQVAFHEELAAPADFVPFSSETRRTTEDEIETDLTASGISVSNFVPAQENSTSALSGEIETPATQESRANQFDFSTILPGMTVSWGIGTVLLLCYFSALHLRSYFFRVRLLSEGGVEEATSSGIRLLFCEKAEVPFALGILRPLIVFPSASRDWPEGKFQAVLLHEQAHVQRRDLLWQNFVCAACILYWFHPLVWFAARRVRFEQELACDDMVLQSGRRSSDYASVLLELSKNLSVSPAVPEGGLAMIRRKTVVKRIDSILDTQTSRTPIGPRATLLLTLCIAFACFAVSLFVPKIPLPLLAQSEEQAAEETEIESPSQESIADTPDAKEQPLLRESWELALAMPEVNDSERFEKLKALNYLLPFSNTEEDGVTRRFISAQMLALAQKMSDPGMKSMELMRIAKVHQNQSDWENYRNVCDAFPAPLDEITKVYHTAFDFTQNGKDEEARILLVNCNEKIDALPPNSLKVAAVLIQMEHFASLGMMDEHDKLLQKYMVPREDKWHLLEKIAGVSLKGTEFYEYLQDNTHRIATNLVARKESGKAYDLGIKMHSYSQNMNHILRFAVEGMVSENRLDEAITKVREMESLDWVQTGWGTSELFPALMKAGRTEDVLQLIRKSEPGGNKYWSLIQHLIKEGKTQQAQLILDEAVLENEKLDDLVDRIDEAFILIALQKDLKNPAKVQAIYETAKKHLQTVLADPSPRFGDPEDRYAKALHLFAKLQFYADTEEAARETFLKSVKQCEKIHDEYSRDFRLEWIAREQQHAGFTEDAFATAELISGPARQTEAWAMIGETLCMSPAKNKLERARYALKKAEQAMPIEDGGRLFAFVRALAQRIRQVEDEQRNVPTEIDFLVYDPVTGNGSEGAKLFIALQWSDGGRTNKTVEIGSDGKASISVADILSEDGSFHFFVFKDGYATLNMRFHPRLGTWPIPRQIVVPMVRGKTIGGTVLDETGAPIPDATIKIELPLRDMGSNLHDTLDENLMGKAPYSQFANTYSGGYKTDRDGKWTCNRFPPDTEEPFVIKISADGFSGTNILVNAHNWLESVPSAALLVKTSDTMSMESLLKNEAETVLHTGIAVRGRVLDEQGQPAKSAVMSVSNYDVEPQFFLTGGVRCDENGEFTFHLPTEMSVNLGLRAEGLAPELFPLDAKKDAPPLEFRLKKGHTIRFRIVDEQGTPLPKVMMILHTGKQGLWLGNLLPSSDAEGRISWNGAPAEAIRYDFLLSGYEKIEQRELAPQEKEHVITMKLKNDAK